MHCQDENAGFVPAFSFAVRSAAVAACRAPIIADPPARAAVASIDAAGKRGSHIA
jgi:hypothetical protein